MTGPNPRREMAKNQLEAEIERIQPLMENATVEDVDTPTGRKDVKISFEDETGFRIEQGVATGVYHEPDRRSPQVVHIDWVSQSPTGSNDGPHGRTSVQWENVETFEEGEYYVSDDDGLDRNG